MKVAIIGAGPAGISAALTLTSKNVHVTILDEQNTIGGQIYRNLETISEKKIQSLDIDHANAKLLFKRVEEAVHQKLLTLISGASVWSVTKNKEVSWSIEGKIFPSMDHDTSLFFVTDQTEAPDISVSNFW